MASISNVVPCFRKEDDKDGSERVGIRRAQLWEIRERWPRKLPDDTGHLAYLGLNRPFSSVAHTSGTNVQRWYRRGDLLSTRALRYLITHVKWLVESYRYRGLSLPDGGIEKKPQPRVLNIIARLEKGPRLYLFSSFRVLFTDGKKYRGRNVYFHRIQNILMCRHYI